MIDASEATTTIRMEMDRTIYARIRALATLRGTTTGVVIQDAAREYAERHRDELWGADSPPEMG